MFEGLSKSKDDNFEGLKSLLSGESRPGVVHPDIRGNIYSIDGSYESEHGSVGDGEELRQDVRRAVYDLGGDPREWTDEIYSELEEKAGEDEYGTVNGGDIAEALRERRSEIEVL